MGGRTPGASVRAVAQPAFAITLRLNMHARTAETAGVGLWRRTPSRDRCVHVEGSYFEWIEEIQEPKFEEIRKRIESFWLRVPEAQRAEYTARLRSKRCTDFFSSYNELWYHQALEAGGFRCFPARVTTAGSLPDWYLAVGERPVAIAECYLRMQPEKDRRDDFVQRRWLDATFKKLKNQRIRLWIHERTCGPGQPSADRLARRLDALAESSPVEEDQRSIQKLGRHQYEDQESGWKLDFTLIVRRSTSTDSAPQLVYRQNDGASWCQGERLFKEALSRKSRQHSTTLPVVICIGWDYFEHEPDFEDVCDVVATKVASFENRGVCGVFWAREVYPWNASPAAPRLLHWRSERAAPLLACWKGEAIDIAKLKGV